MTDAAPATGTLAQGEYAFFTYRPEQGHSAELSVGSGDVDLFVAPGHHERPTKHAHVWRATEGAQRVVVPLTEGQPNELVIAVHARSAGMFSIASKVHTRVRTSVSHRYSCWMLFLFVCDCDMDSLRLADVSCRSADADHSGRDAAQHT